MFSVYTTGILMLNYGYILTQVDAALVQKFHHCIKEIPGFGHISSDITRFPSVKIEDVFLNKPEVLAQFKAAVEEFGMNLS